MPAKKYRAKCSKYGVQKGDIGTFVGRINRKIAIRFKKSWHAWGKQPYTWMSIDDVEEIKEVAV